MGLFGNRSAVVPNGLKKKNKFLSLLTENWQLHLLVLPALLHILVFDYFPLYGVQIAFRKFLPGSGIWGSEWAGFYQFRRFFNSYVFWELIRNTIVLSIYQLVAGFPLPIILALMLNQSNNPKFRKFVQTVTYAPHFVSIVVLGGIIFILLSPSSGVINHFLEMLGHERIFFMGDPRWYRTIYVASGLWQSTGWSAIVFVAALSSIDPSLYESARVDGANKWHLIRHIDIPGILPTIIIMLILSLGRLFGVGFDKSYLLQNELNVGVSEVISTYVYKIGLLSAQFSYASAVGVFNNIINLILLVTVNKIARTVSDISLW